MRISSLQTWNLNSSNVIAKIAYKIIFAFAIIFVDTTLTWKTSIQRTSNPACIVL